MSAAIFDVNGNLVFMCGKTFRDQVLAPKGPVPSTPQGWGDTVSGADILENIDKVITILKEDGRSLQAEFFSGISPEDVFFVG